VSRNGSRARATVHRDEYGSVSAEPAEILPIAIGRGERETVATDELGDFLLGHRRTRKQADEIALAERSLTLRHEPCDENQAHGR
jgi:hypothetical protein